MTRDEAANFIKKQILLNYPELDGCEYSIGSISSMETVKFQLNYKNQTAEFELASMELLGHEDPYNHIENSVLNAISELQI